METLLFGVSIALAFLFILAAGDAYNQRKHKEAPSKQNEELPQLRQDAEISYELADWAAIGLTNLAEHDKFEVRYEPVSQERLLAFMRDSLSEDQYPKLFIELVRAAMLSYDLDSKASDRILRNAVEPAIELGLLRRDSDNEE